MRLLGVGLALRAGLGCKGFSLLIGELRPAAESRPHLGLRKRPLNAAFAIEVRVIADAAEIARLTAREFFEDLKRGFRRAPIAEQLAAAPRVGDELENRKIAQRLSRRAGNFFHEPEAA